MARVLAALAFLLSSLAWAEEKAAAPAADTPTAYACIRVVRAEPGTPGKPEILLPAGYALEAKGNHEAASPGEYYVFLRGPKGVAAGVAIRWPGVKVAAVIHGDARLPLKADGDRVTCDVPVAAASLRAAWPTLEVHTNLSDKGVPIRIEHNHPDRHAGKFADGPWVDGPARACVNFLFASRTILRDWPLAQQLRQEGKGTISLMGFESNNPLHGDWPAHWHFIYYLPVQAGAPTPEPKGSCVPHFYMDEKGRVTWCKFDVFGRPDLSRRVEPGDPMLYADADGRVRMAVVIRPDGGVDLGPEAGRWTYSIVPGGDDGGLADSVRILRDGKPWRRVTARDDTARGVLSVKVEPLDAPGAAEEDVWPYDPLTGALRKAG